jgi:ribose transport system ATP-binding protein
MLELGVAVIYQEFAQAPHLTVAENIFLGRLPTTRAGRVDWSRLHKAAAEVMARLGFAVDLGARVDSLSVAQRQMIEIARALSRSARIIVLDEPSAVLGDTELARLFAIIRRLSREEGVTFVYISHRLKEVFEIGDTVTVLRDGRVVDSTPLSAIDTATLICMMVGREVADVFPKRTKRPGEIALRVEGLARQGVLEPIDLELRAGEIVGVCGLAGSGRSELLRAIVGADPIDAGTISIFGQPVTIGSPAAAIRLGLGLLPEDRKTDGLFLNQAVRFNVTIAGLKQLMRGIALDRSGERRLVQGFVDRLHIRTPSLDTAAGNLSGGNQQKCVLAKNLHARCRILLVDEPTRGIDVGAKREIYELMIELTEQQGAAILMVSSELPEILGLSDRILVMRDGRVAKTMERGEADEESIMRWATVH